MVAGLCGCDAPALGLMRGKSPAMATTALLSCWGAVQAVGRENMYAGRGGGLVFMAGGGE